MNFPAPKNAPELQRFLGRVNQLIKFTKDLASLTTPLWQLLQKKKKKNIWT